VCYFIHLEVLEKAEKALCAAMISYCLTPDQSLLVPSRSAFTLIQNMCACDLYGTIKEQLTNEQVEERIRARFSLPRYRKKGYTEKKIRDAIDAEIRRLRDPSRLSGMDVSLAEELAHFAQVHPVSVLVYWSNVPRRFEEESLPSSTFVARATSIRENTFYHIIKSPRSPIGPGFGK